MYSSGACPAEFYDGKADKVRCFNDFYVYSPKKDRWTQVISPGGCALARASKRAREHCLYQVDACHRCP